MHRKASAERRILIVEDDPSIAAGLAMNLQYEGLQVEISKDGEQGLRRALEWSPDLVILDLMLPGMNGYEVCRAIRERASDIAILILSAKGREQDKVLGLDLGADDYITKPFGIKELLARIQAVLRRRASAKSCTVQFGEVTVDLAAHSVTHKGVPVDLTAQELKLLEHFVTRPGRVLSRTELLDAAWGLEYEGTERTVDNFVRRLRVKLEPDPEAPRHLVTVIGLGYRFDP
jgi:DNA-binding response OmpR family regulator